MIQVRIVRVHFDRKDEERKPEQEIAQLRNAGWRIVAAGGGTGKAIVASGFVVLERETPA